MCRGRDGWGWTEGIVGKGISQGKGGRQQEARRAEA